jgi:hypothetical protein
VLHLNPLSAANSTWKKREWHVCMYFCDNLLIFRLLTGVSMARHVNTRSTRATAHRALMATVNCSRRVVSSKYLTIIVPFPLSGVGTICFLLPFYHSSYNKYGRYKNKYGRLHHLSRETSTAGHRPPRRSVLCCPHPATSPDRRSTLWGAYQRCVSRYAVATRGPFRPNGRQSSSQCALPTATAT